MQQLLETVVGENSATFYLGGYGNFDSFAFACARKYQRSYPNITLAFVTPYISLAYQEKHLRIYETEYDMIIYPPIEHVLPKFAIVSRNKWMAEQADAVIAFVNREWGGAYTMYKHAIRKHKRVFNLAEMPV